MKNRLKKQPRSRSALTAIVLAGFGLITPGQAVQAKKEPFSGSWVSQQYTNGKEFFLKLEQNGSDLSGWEGRLPASTEGLPVDLTGTIKGKEADIEIKHRRGYKANAHLRLQGDKLVFQLFESDSRSSRYFPLASTLRRQPDTSNGGELNPKMSMNSSGNGSISDSDQKSSRQADSNEALYKLLETADSFDSGTRGEAAEISPYFSAYKALLSSASLLDQGLIDILKCKSPAARLYAAAIIWDLSHEEGIKAFSGLLKDSEPVDYRSGCELFKTSVGEIAGSFVKNGSYLDFPAKKY